MRWQLSYKNPGNNYIVNNISFLVAGIVLKSFFWLHETYCVGTGNPKNFNRHINLGDIYLKRNKTYV